MYMFTLCKSTAYCRAAGMDAGQRQMLNSKSGDPLTQLPDCEKREDEPLLTQCDGIEHSGSILTGKFYTNWEDMKGFTEQVHLEKT